MMNRNNGCLRVLDPKMHPSVDALPRREMMACSSAESHAHCVGGQSSVGWTASFRMTSASNCQTGKGPRKGINLSCHHYRCHCNHHQQRLPPSPPPYRTFTTITPPPDKPSRRSGLSSMHITLP